MQRLVGWYIELNSVVTVCTVQDMNVDVVCSSSLAVHIGGSIWYTERGQIMSPPCTCIPMEMLHWEQLDEHIHGILEDGDYSSGSAANKVQA